MNSWDPSGEYDYLATEEIGSSIGPNKVGTPIQLMTSFKYKFKQVFPFVITGCSEPLADGTYCQLHATETDTLSIGCPPQTCGMVQVFFINSTEFGFRVVSNGYFDAPNSWITFSIVNKNCTDFLQQHGYAHGTAGVKGIVIGLFAKYLVWKFQAERLRFEAWNSLDDWPSTIDQIKEFWTTF